LFSDIDYVLPDVLEEDCFEVNHTNSGKGNNLSNLSSFNSQMNSKSQSKNNTPSHSPKHHTNNDKEFNFLTVGNPNNSKMTKDSPNNSFNNEINPTHNKDNLNLKGNDTVINDNSEINLNATEL